MMKKKIKGPTWKKGQVFSPPVYYPPQEMADPEAHLTEEQKKWPRTELLIGPPTGEEPLPVQELSPNPPAEPAPKLPPAA